MKCTKTNATFIVNCASGKKKCNHRKRRVSSNVQVLSNVFFKIIKLILNQSKQQTISHKQQSPITHKQQSPITHKQTSPISHKQPSPIPHKQPSQISHKQPSPISHKQPSPISRKQPIPIPRKHPSPISHKQHAVNPKQMQPNEETYPQQIKRYQALKNEYRQLNNIGLPKMKHINKYLPKGKALTENDVLYAINKWKLETTALKNVGYIQPPLPPPLPPPKHSLLKK